MTTLLETLKKLEAERTRGQWRVENGYLMTDDGRPMGEKNAAFIAALANAAPAILAVLEAATKVDHDSRCDAAGMSLRFRGECDCGYSSLKKSLKPFTEPV